MCVYVDDKKLSSVLKKMSLQPINGVEEVNIFVNTGEVIHIKQPKSKFICVISVLVVMRDASKQSKALFHPTPLSFPETPRASSSPTCCPVSWTSWVPNPWIDWESMPRVWESVALVPRRKRTMRKCPSWWRISRKPQPNKHAYSSIEIFYHQQQKKLNWVKRRGKKKLVVLFYFVFSCMRTQTTHFYFVSQ